MNVRTIVKRLGGSKEVQALTELSKGRISQWCTDNRIPRAWLLFLQEKKPEAFAPPKRKGARPAREARAA